MTIVVFGVLRVNPIRSSRLFYNNSLDQSISSSRVSGYFLLFLYFIEIPIIKANIVDPDQTPQSGASDLDLHCLPITLLRVSRLKTGQQALCGHLV